MVKTMIAGVLMLSVFTASLSGLSGEQKADHREAAKKLYKTLTPKNKLLDRMASFHEPMIEQMRKQGVAEAKLEKVREAMLAFSKKIVEDEHFDKRMISIYADTFSRNEINKLMKFYETPTGQKVLEKLPNLFQRGSKVGQEIGKKYQPALRKRIREIMSGSNAREEAPVTQVKNNLRLLEDAKQQWALEENASPEAECEWNDVAPYLDADSLEDMGWPAGVAETVNINAVNESCTATYQDETYRAHE